MKELLKLFIATTVFAFFAMGFSHAQRYNVQKLGTEKGKSRGVDFLGVDKDGFVYLSSFRTYNFILVNVSQPWIKVVSSETGGLVAEANMDRKELKEMGYKYVSIIFVEDKPLLVVRKRSDLSGAVYYGLEIDRSLNFIGAPFKIGERPSCKGFNVGNVKSFSNSVDYFQDKNGKTIFLSETSCSNDQTPSFLALHSEAFTNPLIEYSFTLPIDNSVVDKQFVFHNDKLYIAVQNYERVKTDKRVFKQIVLINRLFVVDQFGSVSSVEVPLGNERIPSQLNFSISNNKIVVSGQIIKSNSDLFLGIFSGVINEAEQTVETTEETLFSEEFITKFWDEKSINKMKRKGATAELTSNYKLIDKFDMEEGATAYVFQQRYVQEVIRNQSTATGMVAPVVDYYFYYLDVMVTKIDSSGNIVWFEKVPLEQSTLNYDPGRGFSANFNQGEIFLLHLSSDARKEMINQGGKTNQRKPSRERIQSSVAITKIDRFGEAQSSEVMNLREERVSFSPTSVAVDLINKRFIFITTPRQMFAAGKRFSVYSIRL